MDTYAKKIHAMVARMAYEDPNKFISSAYHAGMTKEEIVELNWAIHIARRAPRYDEKLDVLKQHNIC